MQDSLQYVHILYKQKEHDYTVLGVFYNLIEGRVSSSSHKWRINVVDPYIEKTHAKIYHLGYHYLYPLFIIDICVPDTILLETN